MNKDNIKQRLFEEICNIYSKDLQRFIFGLTRKDQFAMEEIFQNTMVKALEGLHTLRENDIMKTWIFAIAKAETKRYYAKKQNQEISDVPDSLTEILFEAGDQIDFTEAIGNRDVLRRLLSKLSEEEQQIYILHYSFDMSLKDISETLHLNYSTVRTMHVRGFHKFHKLIGRGLLIWIMTIINLKSC